MNRNFPEVQAPLGVLKGISFSISNYTDIGKTSVFEVRASSEVTDSRLGLPNPESQCLTCGSNDRRTCEGHFGVINFGYSVIHPYFLSEIVKLLNKVCPGCKYIRLEKRFKGTDSEPRERPITCRYCRAKTWYPSVKFRVSSKEVFRKSAVIVEVSEKSMERLRVGGKTSLPPDFWDFLPKDTNIDESCLKPTRRVLTHAQVYSLIGGIDERFVRRFIPMLNSIPLRSFPVTPNGHRVTELVHSFTGSRLVFDERTRIYKKLVDFKGHGLELSSRVIECLQYSRLFSETTSSSQESANPFAKKSDTPKLCGLRFMKDVLLGKRSDHTFRTVVVGDPCLKLDEIGIPCRIAERLLVSENLNNWNWERLVNSCDLRLLEKGETYIKRGEEMVTIRSIEELRAGDNIFRPLMNGDIVMMNRPPSIHQHSLIAMSARLLPTRSVISLNPICCHPFRGDFDGDCLHGYVPQSVQTRTELNELVALDKQLINGQNGRNLLILGQDSLTAAYLVNVEKNRLLKRSEIQQLRMYCPFEMPPPAMIRASLLDNKPRWTGMQIFSMLFPPGFNFEFPSNDVVVRNGDLLSSSEGSAWLRDCDGNFIQNLIDYDKSKVLDIVYSAQEMLSEWLSMRGLSVSLSDLYLSTDTESRRNMLEEINYGLQEAEQVCNFQQLTVNSCLDLLAGNDHEEEEEEENDLELERGKFCYDRQRSAKLSQVSVEAFKGVFRDIQTLAYRYGNSHNSFLIMSKAGSKGNIGKLVQHSMSLGLQHSLVPLSFGFPPELSCSAWNNGNSPLVGTKFTKSFIPFGVVENSFLSGLNPLEAFVHSVTSRDSSFSDNADLPGTLSRRLMFFMRDIYASYDGTVRNSYGNHLVQFSYQAESVREVAAGDAVGSLSGCAISEAAYSALDQPISLLETSPLLNLKNVLECGSKKGIREQTMSLYLSEILSKKKYGFEYGSLEVKNHLEKLMFSEIVSTVTIIFSPQADTKNPLSPWVCHFHVSKELAKRKLLKVESIVQALYKQYMTRKNGLELDIADLKIRSNDCSDKNSTKNDGFCITVTIVEVSKKSSTDPDSVRCMLIPFLLDSVVKGFREVKKVEILWTDQPKAPKKNGNPSGELFLKVTMEGNGWNKLLDNCVQIIELIDWTRSHPDNIHQCGSAFGIGVGWRVFLANLESAISDTGKTILPQHLILAADALSVSGEFVGLNAKGWAKQRQISSAPSPFTQACFSSPSDCFLKAAKAGVKDELQGSIDALAWGNVPSFGNGNQFEIIYSEKEHGFTKPVDVYDLLSSTATLPKTYSTRAPNPMPKSDKSGLRQLYSLESSIPKAMKTLSGKGISKSYLRSKLTWNDIMKLSRALGNILGKYEINDRLGEADQKTLMIALYFHPNRDEKIGGGAQEIKVGYSSEHKDTRCFKLIRKDGSMEDFSYHKCVLGAIEIIAPSKVNLYKAKMASRHKGDFKTLKP
ncbi:PREDICTED: DNA-directed RNA polymerase IV subunit 1 isoform X2 [Tarenaya hassleriana]|uniref:DNA-directed RNA polymerase IV subunit 1 isoform X2 n=1 Tax=Tarenaya hassleriana TaxID=28532 RepID=UPI00053C94CD|nr:PREDICTED: DNA-directed RNA polymerase IV subunit 1 isoform X2 [Tarenaya hassleriana]